MPMSNLETFKTEVEQLLPEDFYELDQSLVKTKRLIMEAAHQLLISELEGAIERGHVNRVKSQSTPSSIVGELVTRIKELKEES